MSSVSLGSPVSPKRKAEEAPEGETLVKKPTPEASAFSRSSVNKATATYRTPSTPAKSNSFRMPLSLTKAQSLSLDLSSPPVSHSPDPRLAQSLSPSQRTAETSAFQTPPQRSAFSPKQVSPLKLSPIPSGHDHLPSGAGMVQSATASHFSQAFSLADSSKEQSPMPVGLPLSAPSLARPISSPSQDSDSSHRHIVSPLDSAFSSSFTKSKTPSPLLSSEGEHKKPAKPRSQFQSVAFLADPSDDADRDGAPASQSKLRTSPTKLRTSPPPPPTPGQRTYSASLPDSFYQDGKGAKEPIGAFEKAALAASSGIVKGIPVRPLMEIRNKSNQVIRGTFHDVYIDRGASPKYVVKVLNQKNHCKGDKVCSKYYLHAMAQYNALLLRNKRVATVINANTAVQDGCMISQFIPHAFDPSVWGDKAPSEAALKLLDQYIEEFLIFAIENNIELDMAPSNFRFDNHGNLYYTDLREEPTEGTDDFIDFLAQNILETCAGNLQVLKRIRDRLAKSTSQMAIDLANHSSLLEQLNL